MNPPHELLIPSLRVASVHLCCIAWRAMRGKVFHWTKIENGGKGGKKTASKRVTIQINVRSLTNECLNIHGDRASFKVYFSTDRTAKRKGQVQQ